MQTDLLGTVVEITYVGEDAVENRNLALLPGMHDAADTVERLARPKRPSKNTRNDARERRGNTRRKSA